MDGCGNLKKVTVEKGLLVSGSITDGTRTVTTTNSRGQVIEEITTVIISNIKLAHTKAALLDGHDRPVIIHHFPDGSGGFAYQEARAYTCGGLVSDTDRHGVITRHAYDALKRRIRTNRLGVTTETHYLGLATETHRIAQVLAAQDTLSATLQGSASTLIARDSRNLAGAINESETPNPTSLVAGNLILSRRIVTDYAPAAGLSRRDVTTVPGNHSQTEEYRLDGSLYQTYGTLSPSMQYAYTATGTGLLTARAFLDVGNHREISATQTDWAGRTVQSGRLATLASTSLLDATSYSYPGTTGQLMSATDADLVKTLYAYNAKGERVVTAVDLNNDATITYGTDQITRTKTFATTRSGSPVMPVNGVRVHGLTSRLSSVKPCTLTPPIIRSRAVVSGIVV